MKKLIIMTAIAVFGFTSVQAQDNGVKLGLNAGIPVGDSGDGSSFGIAIDAAYLVTVADSFQVGPAIGYQHYFSKEYDGPFGTTIEPDDFQFIPIAGAARFDLDGLFFGADLGYAIGINDDFDGGFYYRPKVGYNLGPVALVLSYTGISGSETVFSSGDFEVTRSGSFSAVNFGVEFGF
ncbi:MAG: hypothetical protein WDZ45_10225 [Flavobacteriaceae bacterium]